MPIRKHLLIIVPFIGILFSGFSCSIANCPNDYDLNNISFNNLSTAELQNVKITGYEKNGKFDKIIDDSYEIVAFEYEKYDWYTHHGTLNKPINTGLDYKIIFEDINDSCLITNITVKENLCSNSLFNKVYSYSFEEYTMNGLAFGCQIIKVFPTRSN
jgi:hypothetical protein